MRLGSLRALVWTALLTVGTPATAGPGSGETMLVLDVSGSMWGRVLDGTKIEVARRAVRALVQDSDRPEALGLVAYGHRRKGDCGDIELLAPVGAGAEAIQAAVDGATPVGMTPLTAAVEAAVDQLGPGGRVILVSDGEETCDRDPCEMARALRARGVDLAVHVIAFDLDAEQTASIACLARETGGKVLQANDTDTLTSALQVAADPTPTAPDDLSAAVLSAPDEVPAGSLFEVSWQGPENPGDVIMLVPAGSPELARGNYVYAHKGSPQPMRALIAPGPAELRYVHTGSGTILGRAAITLTEVSATLDAPGEVAAGARVEIGWTGPAYPSDFVAIVPLDWEDGGWPKNENRGWAKQSPTSVTAPITPGEYTLIYGTGQGREALARRPITVVASTVSVEAPAEVVAGARVEVTWAGPGNKNDFVAIVPLDWREGDWPKSENRGWAKRSPTWVTAPIAPGAYALIYGAGQGREALARRPITVVAAEVSVDAPAEVVAGSRIDVPWTGPGNKNDFVAIVPLDWSDGDWPKNENRGWAKQSPTPVTVPIAPGAYVLIYGTWQGRQALSRRPITVVAAEVSVEAPAVVAAGGQVDVQWTGPANPLDFLAIVPLGWKDGDWPESGHRVWVKNRPTRITAPSEPGEYLLIYGAGQGNVALLRRPLTVTAEASP